MAPALNQRFVVFGCGYIGSAVARRVLARGMQVTALTRNVETGAALAAAGIEVVVADLASLEWHRKIPGDATYVLNSVSAGGAGIEGYRHSYLEGARSIRDWAAVRRIGTLVYTSSTSVYPQGDGAAVDERSPTAGADERGELLVQAERVFLDRVHADSRGQCAASDRHQKIQAGWDRCFILRLAGIYGPGRHQLLEQVRTGRVAGRGDHRLNLIHRDDVCAAILAAFEAPPAVRGDVLNVADDHPSPKAEVAGWLASRLDLPPPEFTGRPAGTRRAVTPDRVISNTKIKRVLGWRPQFPDYRAGYENILSPRSE